MLYIGTGGATPAVSLLFARGERPRAEDVHALTTSGGGFSVSLDPYAESEDAGLHSGDQPEADASRWVELLLNGLSFDLTGLAPGLNEDEPPFAYGFGLPQGFPPEPLEAITLRPGGHLAGGATLLPVVRGLALLAARLSELPGLQAIAWHPARCWSAPQHFHDSVTRWCEGGAFPALGLAGLRPTAEGGLQSEGLALFTGQELRLQRALTEDRAEAAKLAIRLLHWLVERGPLVEAEQLIGPDGEPLLLEPSGNGRFIAAWRG